MDDKSSSDPNISIITDHIDTRLHYFIPSHSYIISRGEETEVCTIYMHMHEPTVPSMMTLHLIAHR